MLIERRRELQDDVWSRIRDGRADRPSEVRDDLEASDADMQGDVELALLQMRIENLSHIEEALVRIGEGTYGRCAECSGEIGARRLRALPFAVRWHACENRRETDQGRAPLVPHGRSGFPLSPDVAAL